MGNKDPYVIQINMPIKSGSLISEIQALPKIEASKKQKPMVEEYKEPVLLSSIGGSKDKKKKKKNKSANLEFMTPEGIVDNIEERVNSILDDGPNLIDIDAILNRDEEEDDVGAGIIDEGRKGYGKLKSDENVFKKEFAEDLTLLYDLLEEINRFGKDLEKRYKQIDGGKVRGTSKNMNDLIMTILSTKTSKLGVMKEISSIKKTIQDLKIKVDAKAKSGANAETSPDLLASRYFQNVLKYGRNKFIQGFGGSPTKDDEDDGETFDAIVADIQSKKDGYAPHEIDNLQKIIADRLDTEENQYHSNEGGRYIDFEQSGVKPAIKKCIDTGDWEFIAVDRDNQEVYGYPLPKKGDVGRMKFSSDSRIATDTMGRSYKVFEFYSSNEEED